MRDDRQSELILTEGRQHREQFQRARKRPYTPVYLRHDRLPGWRADLPLYVIYCDECARYSVTNPAGYHAKIRCDGCRGYATVPEHALHPEGPESLWFLAKHAAQLLVFRARKFVGLGPPRLPPPEGGGYEEQ